jgi:hypothetical protein
VNADQIPYPQGFLAGSWRIAMKPGGLNANFIQAVQRLGMNSLVSARRKQAGKHLAPAGNF